MAVIVLRSHPTLGKGLNGRKNEISTVQDSDSDSEGTDTHNDNKGPKKGDLDPAKSESTKSVLKRYHKALPYILDLESFGALSDDRNAVQEAMKIVTSLKHLTSE